MIAVVSDFSPIYDLRVPQNSAEFVLAQCKESSTFFYGTPPFTPVTVLCILFSSGCTIVFRNRIAFMVFS